MRFNLTITLTILWAIMCLISVVIGDYHVAFLEAVISFLLFEKYYDAKVGVK